MGSMGQNSNGSMRHTWMLLYELSTWKASAPVLSCRHTWLMDWYMFMDGLVIQNT